MFSSPSGEKKMKPTRSFLVETDGTRCTRWWFDVRRWFSRKSEKTEKQQNLSDFSLLHRLLFVYALSFYFCTSVSAESHVGLCWTWIPSQATVLTEAVMYSVQRQSGEPHGLTSLSCLWQNCFLQFALINKKHKRSFMEGTATVSKYRRAVKSCSGAAWAEIDPCSCCLHMDK